VGILEKALGPEQLVVFLDHYGFRPNVISALRSQCGLETSDVVGQDRLCSQFATPKTLRNAQPESIAWVTVSLPLALPDSDREYPEGTEVWFISGDAAIKPLEWEQELIEWLKSQGL